MIRDSHTTIARTTGFHEIQLSGKQLVFLFMATTIVAVVIFLCGVQVGRGVEARSRRPTTPTTRRVGDACRRRPRGAAAAGAAAAAARRASRPRRRRSRKTI